MARALDTTPHWLLTGDDPPAVEPPGVPVDLAAATGRDLPVYGLARVRDAYALIVTGASMEPKYEAGDMVFLNPHRPPRRGDHVVIQEAREGGIIVTIKRFERWTDGHLITTQYNPPSEVRFARDQIMAVHRVLTTNELFGI